MISLNGSYELKQGDKVVGNVQVEKQGLYYRISCRCRLTGNEIHRLTVTCGGRTENLGICVPMEGGFGVEKKLPCKNLGQGTPEFTLVPKQEKMQGKFVAVYPEEPFSYMARLKGAFLARQAEQLGIVIPE